jgi:exonuclease SbcC
MVVKKIRLENFKSHADTTIEFEQITSLIGASDNGKTNIIRALRIVLFNENWPPTWIRYNQSESSITVFFENGSSIKRTRTAKHQSISFTYIDGTTESFDGKKDVDGKVKKFTGFKKLVTDDENSPENLNFINIHDGPYLLGSSSLTVQKKIAGLLGTSQLENVRTKLQKEKKAVVKEESEVQNDLTRTTASISTLKERIQVAENSFNEIDKLNQERDKFSKTAQNVNNFIEQFGTSLTKTSNCRLELQELENIFENIKLILKQKEILQQYKELRIPFPVVNLEPLQEQYQAYLKNISKLKTLQKYILTKVSLMPEILETKRQIDLITELKLKKLGELGICPTCGNAL